MAGVAKIDLYREHAAEYVTPKTPTLVDVGPAHYLSLAGAGRPGEAEFQQDVGVLYSMAFTTKMMLKASGRDYAVCKLEALWRVEADKPLPEANSHEIHYELLIRTPELVDASALEASWRALAKKGRSSGPAADVGLARLEEGRCVQVLHLGPYAREGETIEAMERFVEERGFVFCGRHHEIYLSDPRRVSGTKLRTILRRPVKAASTM